MKERSEKARYWRRRFNGSTVTGRRMACGAVPRRQHGVALMVMLGLLLLVSSAILLDRLNSQASANSSRDAATTRALRDAKAALIAWSTTYLAWTQVRAGPGTLPYPDRNGDGNFDGMADCDAYGDFDPVLLGRLPWAGEVDDLSDPPDDCDVTTMLSVNLRDGAGEPLWYAVSRNLITRSRTASGGNSVTLVDAFADFIAAGTQVGSTVVNATDGSQAVVTNVASATQLDLNGLTGGITNLFAALDKYVLRPSGPINPGMGQPGRMAYPWIQLRDSQGIVINDPNTGNPLAVAAVIFAPGAVVGNQDRSGAAAANYLDSITIGATTYDNSDADGCPDNQSPPCLVGGVPAGEEFVVNTNPQSEEDFNDKLIYITVNELMRAVEKRVLAEVALALSNARFRDLPFGTATGGSGTRLDDTGGVNFNDYIPPAPNNIYSRKVELGFYVDNLTDGSWAIVTGVNDNSLDLTALSGGGFNSFQAGDLYQIGQPYPWLAEFRNPRDLSQGVATSGSGSVVNAAGANFVADKVRFGDTIINESTGGRGFITDVTATSISFNALEGGSDAEFDAGETYRVEAAFTSEPGRRHGLIPVSQRPSEIFKTGFTIDWYLEHVHDLSDDSGGAGSALKPEPRPTVKAHFTAVIGPEEGYCRWTVESRVDCYGMTVGPFQRFDLPGDPIVQRTIEVNIDFDASGTDASEDLVFFDNRPAVVVNPPTATSPRTRDLTISDRVLPGDIPAQLGGLAPELPTLVEGAIIKITDELAGDWGSEEVLLCNGDCAGLPHGQGVIIVSGIRYESVVNFDSTDAGDDLMPEWFADNDWHHYIYAAFADDVVAGGDGDCTTPSDTCLTLNVAGNPDPRNIQGLVISSGAPLFTQDRTIGDCDGDGGGPITDAADDSFLCAYFDDRDAQPDPAYDVAAEVLRHGGNASSITVDTYARDNYSNNFNDQVRIIDLAP